MEDPGNSIIQGCSYNPDIKREEETPSNKNYKLEFMFMKHYAPNRCEPSIEVLNFGGGGGGGGERGEGGSGQM